MASTKQRLDKLEGKAVHAGAIIPNFIIIGAPAMPEAAIIGFSCEGVTHKLKGKETPSQLLQRIKAQVTPTKRLHLISTQYKAADYSTHYD